MSKTKKKISKKYWQDHITKNCFESYSLVTSLAVLSLWEASVKNEEEAHKVLLSLKLGLSGAQAAMAIGLVLSSETPDWLDKDMVKISTDMKGENDKS